MVIRVPQLELVFDRRKVSSLSKKGIVEIRITYERKQKYISTGISLYQSQWRKGKAVNTPQALEQNQILDKLIKDVWKIILEMMEEDNIDIFSISTRLTKLNESELTFIDFCRKRAEVRKYGKEKDTKDRYDRFIRLFGEWNGIVTFKDINENNIIAYDRYLSEQGMKPYSKWNNYHRFLSGFIQDAIQEGLLQKNPYNWVVIEKNKVSYGLDKCLTLEEFRKLKDFIMPTKSLERVRDLFIFQTCTCLRYSDLRRFNVSDIVSVNGMKVYKFTQKKTKKETVIPLLQTALDILIKYHDVLPIISNVKYNEYLKVVAQAAGIDKPLSTHWARHTGATILLNEGISMQVVSKICGHSSTRITEKIYAKLLDETVVNAVSNLKV